MRHVNLFNDHWKFHSGEAPGSQATDFNDGAWKPISLPHDWSVEGPFDSRWASATGFLPGGIGWYRKKFSAVKPEADGKVYLHFDGVYCNSQVWINGEYLGCRPSGFVPFRYDITPHLKLGGENVVAVRVDHSRFADCRWYTGSGIYRNAYLIQTGPVHIKQDGVFVTTPAISPSRAEVEVELTAENHGKEAGLVEVEHTLLDDAGLVVATLKASMSIPAGGEQSVLRRLVVPKPKLWSPKNPALYLLRTVLRLEGNPIDQEETTVGIRSIRFDPNEGFFLNGENMKLKGVCVHDDAGALGTAVPAKVWERRLRILKAAGVNAIRMAHNPHMPELYDLCDRLGFLVQDEAFDEWEEGKRKWIQGWNVGQAGTDGTHDYFREWGAADLREMVLRDRNHPCVFMWSIGNEIDYPNDPYSHPVLDTGTNPQIASVHYYPNNPPSDRLGVIARQLVGIVKQYDTSRPVTAALAGAIISNETGFAQALDVVGYNYQEYLYEEDHQRFPSHVLYGSENGMRWEFWKACLDHPYISGQFLWTGIDYLGEAGRWPTRSNGAGLLDLAGLPKPEFYYRQSLWSETPMIFAGTSPVPQGNETVTLWSHQYAEPVWSGTQGEPVRVTCFTNCQKAELLLNGKSLGVKNLSESSDRLLTWDVPYEPGLLVARGFNDGQSVATWELQTSGPAKKMRVECDVAKLRGDGIDVAHVVVTALDEAGSPVYLADQEITWTVEGPGRLLGLESGNHASHENYRANKRKLYHGRMLGYIQAEKTPGVIRILLSAPGLEGASVSISVEEVS